VLDRPADFVALAAEVDRAARRPDRMRFLRFTRLADTSQIPERTTIWTIKERLITAGASESVFDAVNRQLAKHGYSARGGQIIDAGIVRVPRPSLNKEEKSIVEDNAMPADWSPPKRRQKDIEARWTKRHGKSYFGDKLSANAKRGWRAWAGECSSSARAARTSRFRQHRSGATGASPGPVHVSSTCSPVSRRWDRKRCAASDWRARRCI